METIKIFFISIFTCSKMKDIRERRHDEKERKMVLNYYDNRGKRRYRTFTRFQNQNQDSDTDSIHYPATEVYID